MFDSGVMSVLFMKKSVRRFVRETLRRIYRVTTADVGKLSFLRCSPALPVVHVTLRAPADPKEGWIWG